MGSYRRQAPAVVNCLPLLRHLWHFFCSLWSANPLQPSGVVMTAGGATGGGGGGGGAGQVQAHRKRWNRQPRLTQEMQSARLGGALTWAHCAEAL